MSTMPIQVDRHKTSALGALRPRNPQTKAVADHCANTTNPKPKYSPPVSTQDKALRSKEWRIAYRRLSFLLEPFKRRSKSADPRSASMLGNGSKSNTIMSVPSTTSFPQPSLIATCIHNGNGNEAQALQVAPVNITGVIFERYKRARGAGSFVSKTQPNGCLVDEPLTSRTLMPSARSVSNCVSSNRPASFHPIFPLSEDLSTSYQQHHNPYLYQHGLTGDNAAPEHRPKTTGSLTYQSFRVQSFVTSAPRATKSDSSAYESLYDFPPSFTPYPCPTFRPDNTRSHTRTVQRQSSSPNRKRLPRPSSIDPFLMRFALRSHKPVKPNASSCRPKAGAALSRPSSELVQRTLTPPADSIKSVGWPSVSATQTDHGVVPAIGPSVCSSVSGFSSNCRHQSFDGSADVCQVTVCHSAPKLCATVVEPSTYRPYLPVMRPRSTLLSQSDHLPSVEGDGPKHTLHPRPEPYLTGARNAASQRSTTSHTQAKSPPVLNGSADLDLTVCSNAASASIRQRRGREWDRLDSNTADVRSTRGDWKISVNGTTGLSQDPKPVLVEDRLNGAVEHKSCQACEAPAPDVQRIPTSGVTSNGTTKTQTLQSRLMNWHSILDGDIKRDVMINGANHRLSASNRNSWSAQARTNGFASREPTPDLACMDEAMCVNFVPGERLLTSSSRPTSVVVAPSPVCLPPPVGKRMFPQPRVPSTTTSTVTEGNAGVVDKLRQEGFVNLATGVSRRYRAPTAPAVRPPRPPTRTTSLVRGVGRESRESSCTPPSDSRTLVPLSDKAPMQITVSEAPCTSPSFQDLITYSSTSDRMTLSDTSVDPRDRLADAEVEQNVADRDTMWWLSLLPYKPSNLPTNLADRLRQRNSLILSRCSPNSRLSNSSLPTTLPHLFHPQPHLQTGMTHSVTGREAIARPAGSTPTPHLMTQSLYEQRDSVDSVYSDRLSPDPTPRASRNDLLPGRSNRARLPTRPSSLYVDKPDPHPILMPSLAHLGSGVDTSSLGRAGGGTAAGTGRLGYENPRIPHGTARDQSDGSSLPNSPSPSVCSNRIANDSEIVDDPLSILSSYSNTTMIPDAILLKSIGTNKTDSPLLGQYCRLLNLRTSSVPHTNQSVTNATDLPTPSAETSLTPV